MLFWRLYWGMFVKVEISEGKTNEAESFKNPDVWLAQISFISITQAKIA